MHGPFLIEAMVKPQQDKITPYRKLVFIDGECDDIQRHNINLQEEGYEVLSVKATPVTSSVMMLVISTLDADRQGNMEVVNTSRVIVEADKE